MDHISHPTDIAFHRNGITGRAFYVVAFRWKPLRDDWRNMVATVWENQEVPMGAVHPCTGEVSVIDATLASQGNVSRPANQWDGTWFEQNLRNWIAVWEKHRDQTMCAKLGIVA